MLKVFVCNDGTVYASTRGHAGTVKVDEVIEFLEQHRGKEFWNGAAGETCFRADDEIVSCDLFSCWMEDMDDEEYAEYIDNWFCKSRAKRGDDSGYSKRCEDDED